MRITFELNKKDKWELNNIKMVHASKVHMRKCMDKYI